MPFLLTGTQVFNSIKAQQWLFDNATKRDRILTHLDGGWVEDGRDLYAAADMRF